MLRSLAGPAPGPISTTRIDPETEPCLRSVLGRFPPIIVPKVNFIGRIALSIYSRSLHLAKVREELKFLGRVADDAAQLGINFTVRSLRIAKFQDAIRGIRRRAPNLVPSGQAVVSSQDS